MDLPSVVKKLSNKAQLARLLLFFGLLQLPLLLPSQALPMGDLTAVGSGSREIFARIWLSADLIAGLLLMGCASRRQLRWLRPVMALALSLVFVLEVYDVFILRAFSRMPVLYNDVLLIWDGLNLAFDLLPAVF